MVCRLREILLVTLALVAPIFATVRHGGGAGYGGGYAGGAGFSGGGGYIPRGGGGGGGAGGYRGGYQGGFEAPRPYDFNYNAPDEFGNAHYRQETGDGSGAVRGSYGYTDSQGLYRHVDYVADAGGFRANVRTNEPGVEAKNPADVSLDVAAPPAGIYGSRGAGGGFRGGYGGGYTSGGSYGGGYAGGPGPVGGGAYGGGHVKGGKAYRY